MSPILILKISSKFYCSVCDFSYSVCFTFSSLEYPVSVISSQIFIVKKAGGICVLNSPLGISFSCELSACNVAYFPKYSQAFHVTHLLTVGSRSVQQVHLLPLHREPLPFLQCLRFVWTMLPKHRFSFQPTASA